MHGDFPALPALQEAPRFGEILQDLAHFVPDSLECLSGNSRKQEVKK